MGLAGTCHTRTVTGFGEYTPNLNNNCVWRVNSPGRPVRHENYPNKPKLNTCFFVSCSCRFRGSCQNCQPYKIYMRLEMTRTSFCLTQAKKNVLFNPCLCVVCVSYPMRKITNLQNEEKVSPL
jgi:hypothetical protein